MYSVNNIIEPILTVSAIDQSRPADIEYGLHEENSENRNWGISRTKSEHRKIEFWIKD